MTQYLGVFDLSSLDGADGFQLNGVATRDYAGWSVSSAGDFNGDGFADFVVSAKKADPNGNLLAGASYVVFGGPTLLGVLDAQDGASDGNVELSSLGPLAGANGFTINGVAASDYSGWSVSSAGDVNDDGFDDIIIGAKAADPHGLNSGASYVVFGSDTSFGATLELSGLDGGDGFKISGEHADHSSGFSVSSAGDINGDGFGDMIVGSPGASPNGNASGAAYVVFGNASGFAANLDLSSLDGDDGFKLNGESHYDNSGVSVASAGDVNGDGIDDFLVGGWRHPSEYDLGCTYLVFGTTSGWDEAFELSTLDGANGYKLQGNVLGAHSGEHVASAGDVNADGFADIIIGARDANSGAGATYVVFGGAASLAALDAADLMNPAVDGTCSIHFVNGATGFRMDGEALYDYSSVSVSSAGDFNGDGFDDVIVGAIHNNATGPGSGASYVVFGRASGFAASFGLAALDGSNGFKIAGEQYSYNGCSVSAAGDINGDGFDDLIVGAYGLDPNGVDPNGEFAGAAYVIYGAMPGEAVTRTGTAIANTIHGSNFNDTLSGLGGADALIGLGGADTMDGGEGVDNLAGGGGNDTLRAGADLDTGETFAGGMGTDTLEIVKTAGNGNVSLSLYSETMTSIERFAMAAGGTGGAAVVSFHGSQFGAGQLSTNLVVMGNVNVTETIVIELADTPGATFSAAGFTFVTYDGADGLIVNGTTGNETITGSSLGDTLTGGAGADVLNGGLGMDFLEGGADNDTYTVDNSSDFISDSSGVDSVRASVNWTLAASLENLTLLTSAINGTGNASANIIIGNAGANILTGAGGNDLLDGKAGADTMIGGAGNDTYIVDNAGDVTTENSSAGGTDLVQSSVAGTLGANLENLTLTGSAAINGTGNAKTNSIVGNAGGNHLDGLAGADTLSGGGGVDFLNGGTEHDTLTGGAGADKFVFNVAIVATNSDTITDFTHASDKIQLDDAIFTALGAPGVLGGPKFWANTTGNAHDADDRIVYNSATGALFYDDDGNGAHGRVLIATLTTHPTLTASDIVVI